MSLKQLFPHPQSPKIAGSVLELGHGSWRWKHQDLTATGPARSGVPEMQVQRPRGWRWSRNERFLSPFSKLPISTLLFHPQHTCAHTPTLHPPPPPHYLLVGTNKEHTVGQSTTWPVGPLAASQDSRGPCAGAGRPLPTQHGYEECTLQSLASLGLPPASAANHEPWCSWTPPVGRGQ